jgi:hypothetical protein
MFTRRRLHQTGQRQLHDIGNVGHAPFRLA